MMNTATVTLTAEELRALLDGLNERDSKLIKQRVNAGPAGMRLIDNQLAESRALADRLITAKNAL